MVTNLDKTYWQLKHCKKNKIISPDEWTNSNPNN